jgi:RNA polymerase sigma-70 factor (ECF subfamily)
MDERDWLAEKFEETRAHLRAVAYRMLGSFGEAEDAVQEAWIRLDGSDAKSIENLGGWLTTVLSRVCLDVLRSRKSRREEAFEEHLPNLSLSREDRKDPEQEALIADSVGAALLVVLGTLAPHERLAFVLHDMFAVPFDEIASIVGCTPVSARQLASRARSKVRGTGGAAEVDPGRQRKVVNAFLDAVRRGDFEALLQVLDPDVALNSDHLSGTLTKIRGARNVAQNALLFSQLAEYVQPVLVNGVAGIISWLPDGRPFSVMGFTVWNGKIVAIDVLRDPGRLSQLDLTVVKE